MVARAALALLLSLIALPARAALLERVGPPAGAFAARAASPAAFALLDDDAARSLAESGRGTASLPLPSGGTLALALERLEVLAPGAVVTATGDDGARPVTARAAVYRGRPAGDPGGWVVLAISPGRVVGAGVVGGERIEVMPVPGRPGLVAVTPDDGDPERAFTCATPDEDPPAAPGARAALPAAPEATPPTPVRLVADVAVDCDHEYYAVKFGADLASALDYAMVLFATASVVYERDLDVTLRLSYLNVWTTAADPYTESDIQFQLTELRDFWRVNRPAVERDLVHLLSGRSLGGGVAYIQGLCSTDLGFAVSQVDGVYSFPTASTTWDAMVVTHETGHNFGSHHTHSCWWQAQGYAPPGALLDTCYTVEGGTCYTGPTGMVPAARGTIMSYCHLAGGMQAIRVEFHPACRTVMRAYAQTTCIRAADPQPPRDLVATTVPGGVALEWAASPSSGVLGYTVYRGALPFDTVPDSVGTTAGTAFLDAGSAGGWYSVRGVRASDATPPSAEAHAAPCGVRAAAAWAAGAAPVALVRGDFTAEGIEDLAVADSAGASVNVLMRRQRCTSCLDEYVALAATALPSPPLALATGDLDEDGVLDLVAGRDGGLSVLRGNSALGYATGTFTATAHVALPGPARAVACADLDEDGIPDVVALGDTALWVLDGLGDDGVATGSLAAPRAAAGALTGARALACADLDGDGILDLAVGMTGGVRVLRGLGAAGRGDGTFAAADWIPAGSAPLAIAAGDAAEDGRPDLAVAGLDGMVRVALALPGGGFAAPVAYAAGSAPHDLAFGDLDRDGIADLAVACTGEGRIALLRGTGAAGAGDGGFAARVSWPVTGAPRALAVADWDADGRPDLASVGGGSAGALDVLAFGCAGTLPQALDLTAPQGGETWYTPHEYTVTWTKGDGVLAVDLDESRDGGARWVPLARGLTGTSWVWTTSGPYTTQARLRVRDAAVPARADAIQADFTLFPDQLLGVAGASPAPAGLRAWPNPSHGRLRVAFTLPDGGPATISLTDIAGRRVASVAAGRFGPGAHEIEFGSGRPLAPGVYLVTLSRAGSALTRRAVVVR